MKDQQRDQAIVSSLQTLATRPWTPPTGHDRDAVVEQLRDRAGGRTDLLIEAAGILLGTRPPDDHDPRSRKYTAGAEMLLDAAGVGPDHPAVQEAVRVGLERRARRPRGEGLTGGIA